MFMSSFPLNTFFTFFLPVKMLINLQIEQGGVSHGLKLLKTIAQKLVYVTLNGAEIGVTSKQLSG